MHAAYDPSDSDTSFATEGETTKSYNDLTSYFDGDYLAITYRDKVCLGLEDWSCTSDYFYFHGVTNPLENDDLQSYADGIFGLGGSSSFAKNLLN